MISEGYKLTNKVKNSEWKNFVKKCLNGTIYQTPQIVKVHANTKNYEPISLFVLNESDEIEALLVGYIIKEKNNVVGKFTSRLVVQYGPLYKNHKALSIILQRLKEISNNKKILFSELRNFYEVNAVDKNVFLNSGHTYEPHYNIFIDLTQPVDNIWSNMYRSLRKNIKKSDKQLVIREIKDKEEIAEFYDCLLETYKRTRTPLADKSLFYNYYEYLSHEGYAKFQFAELKEEKIIVGVRLTLYYNNIIHANYVGTKTEYLKLNANSLLNYRIMRDGCEGGYKLFDFGGAGSPADRYGPREYKESFGGKLIDAGYFKYRPFPLKYKAIMNLYKLSKKIPKVISR